MSIPRQIVAKFESYFSRVTVGIEESARSSVRFTFELIITRTHWGYMLKLCLFQSSHKHPQSLALQVWQTETLPVWHVLLLLRLQLASPTSGCWLEPQSRVPPPVLTRCQHWRWLTMVAPTRVKWPSMLLRRTWAATLWHWQVSSRRLIWSVCGEYVEFQVLSLKSEVK